MTPDRDAAYSTVDEIANWSEWQPFSSATRIAPRVPGVYQLRLKSGLIVYVGMAGERRGQGIRGRLSVYRRGRGAVSGFGEAALDRALSDVNFIEEHLDHVKAGTPSRASAWARDAIQWLDVDVRWAACTTGEAASVLERAVVELLLVHGIWNRVAVTAVRAPTPADIVVGLAAELGVGSLTTVARLTYDLGLKDGGKSVRRILREGFPDHVRNTSWDPLTSAQVAYVRARIGRILD